MLKRRKVVFALLGAAVCVAALAVFALKKVHIVNPAPAIAVANEYFSDMQQGNPDAAFGLYSNTVREQLGDNWKGFMRTMPKAFGAITSYSVEQGHIVPVDGKGCYLLRYDIQRTQVNSTEGFLICPTNGARWEIIGHELTRTDTGQHIAGGTIPREIGVHTP
jgi:hypothetical protein